MDQKDRRAGVFEDRAEDAYDPLRVLPPELAVLVFWHVPLPDIARWCRLVSRAWNRFFAGPDFWLQCMTKGGNYDSRLKDFQQNVNWSQLCFRAVHKPNLLRNLDSSTKKLSLEHWKVAVMTEYSNTGWDKLDLDAGEKWKNCLKVSHGWTVEDKPLGGAPFDPPAVVQENEGSPSCFATTYYWCCRKQVVDLWKFGFTAELLNTLQPVIEVSEWFAARADCGSIYKLRVDLLNSKRVSVCKYEFSKSTEQWQGGKLGWRKVFHKFCNYGEGVRYVRFVDGGKDTQFWSGDYGSKMAAARVVVRFNEK